MAIRLVLDESINNDHPLRTYDRPSKVQLSGFLRWQNDVSKRTSSSEA